MSSNGSTLFWLNAADCTLALLAVVVAYAGLRAVATGGLITTGHVRYIENPLVEEGPLFRFLTASWVAIKYLGLFLVPYPLSADYSYDQIPVIQEWGDPRAAAVVLLLGLAGAAVPLLRRRAPSVAVALLFFVLLFLPVSNALFPIGTIMAERLLYLPSVALCFAVGLMANAGVSRSAPRLARAIVVFLLCSVTAAHVWLVVRRNRDWASDETLFAETVRTSPRSAKARFNYGSALLEAGRPESAEEMLQSSIALAPAYPEAHNLLGTIRLARGEVGAAGKAFEAAVHDSPSYPPALANLGIVRRREGRLGEAAALLERALAQDPSMAVAHVNLALIAEIQGDVPRAVQHYQLAFALDPELKVARDRAEALDAARAK